MCRPPQPPGVAGADATWQHEGGPPRLALLGRPTLPPPPRAAAPLSPPSSSSPQVGYDFKSRRFSELHRAALRLPAEAFRYEGTPALNEGALLGEAATVAAFEGDPYGCGPDLRAKRMQRDPFAAGGYNGDRQVQCWQAAPAAPLSPVRALASAHVLLHRPRPSLERRCPDMSELISYCGPKLFDGPLPWDNSM